VLENVRSASEDQFLAAFEALAQAVRRARGAPARAGDRALTLSQYSLLQGLAGREAARVQDLAVEAGITASTATRILDALERREIVERARSDEDRRVVIVTLTESGRELLQSQADWLRGCQREFFATLPQSERESAPDLLLRLAVFIDDLAAGPDEL
jgi:DNA-binding MarR family transcriptional regulator